MELIPEFVEFRKIPRLFRHVVITEKIDGTNGCIYIGAEEEFAVGSRTRWITPDNDNHGFARWAYDNREELMKLGPGLHYGEWWGQGIQRNYGLKEKRFSLFNTSLWCEFGKTPQVLTRLINRETSCEIVRYQNVLPSCVSLVPELYRGPFSLDVADSILKVMRTVGSLAVPGFMKPEGIVLFHTAGNFMFKATLENDESSKSQVKNG